jgi:hypothetical protein
MGLEEDYSHGAALEGGLKLEGLMKNDWGAYWNQHQRYEDGTDGYFSLGYPSHRLLYGSAAWYGRRKDYTFAARSNVSRLPGNPVAYDVGGTWSTFARPLGSGNWSYYGSLDLGLASLPNTGRAILQQQERLTLFPRRVTLGKDTNLSLRTDLAFGADSSGGRGAEWIGRLGVDQSLSKGAQLSLAYLYQKGQGNAFFSSSPSQQLSANLYWGGGSQEGGYINSTYDLSGHYLNSFGGFGHSFSKDLRLELRSQYLSYPLGNYVDNEVSLMKNIGGRWLELGWSQSRHSIWFEFLPGRF